MNPDFLQHRSKWRTQADALIQPLNEWCALPVAAVETVHDAEAWQETAVRIIQAPAPGEISLSAGEEIILDFGEHLVGHLHFGVSNRGRDYDCPVVLRILAAETPYEITYTPQEYRCDFAPGWMQEETMRIIQPSADITVPNRMALRFLKIQVLSTPASALISNLHLKACSSAGRHLPDPPSGLTPKESDIYRAGCRTLRNCMQGVFEDGPKRDRRLWLGDLRLQALLNAVTYRNQALAERSIYLLAAATDDSGAIASCAYENPQCGSGCKIMEYPLLLAPTLLEHLRAYGNTDMIRELYPLAEWQFTLYEDLIDRDHLIAHDGRRWLVIDHSMELEKDTAFQGMYIFCLEALAQLAAETGRDNRKMLERCRLMREALRKHRRDRKTGYFFSGSSRQFSVASQAWAVMGKVVTGDEARALLEKTVADKKLFPVCSPYMQHYLLEACSICGAGALLRSLILEYWGSMLDGGATTFYEIYRPDMPFYSPYGSPWANSACHAWSCTPACFLQ